MQLNPIFLEIFKNKLSSIAEEMGVTLNRTAFSPNIKERRDFSCALFNAQGEMIAQAAHIPVHLGSMPLSVQAALQEIDFAPGDMVVLNDPFKGGTHLPDITIIAPVFVGNSQQPEFFVANRAHHSDVGGMSSGSMPLSTSIYQEGIVIPPLKIMEKGNIDPKVMKLFLNNVRTPTEREGDFTAQIMANEVGIKRIQEVVSKYGLEQVKFYADGLLDYAEKMLQELILRMPNGHYEFEDYLEDDGLGQKDIKIHLQIEVNHHTVTLDFRQSAPQVKGSVNAVFAITLSAVLYVFRSLLSQDVPTNSGLLRPIKILTTPGSVVDAKFPAGVAGGNVETSQRIVDVILGALAKAIPEQIPAASQGTMNNITIGGVDQNGQPFTYYETLGGGMGASAHLHGASGVHSHMTNTLNTPIEALEFSYPFLVTKYGLRTNSGGKGKFRGGEGLIREIKLLTPAEVTVLSERRRLRPYGLDGGEPGQPGKNLLVQDGEVRQLPGKFNLSLEKETIIRIETPGGGGYGKI